MNLVTSRLTAKSKCHGGFLSTANGWLGFAAAAAREEGELL